MYIIYIYIHVNKYKYIYIFVGCVVLATYKSSTKHNYMRHRTYNKHTNFTTFRVYIYSCVHRCLSDIIAM